VNCISGTSAACHWRRTSLRLTRSRAPRLLMRASLAALPR
jgi:hypothetical protein